MTDVIDNRILRTDQETNVNLAPLEQTMQVSTTDTTMRKRLRQLLDTEGSEWTLIHEDNLSMIVEAPKNLLTLRAKTRTVSKEQREASARRLKEWRESGELRTRDQKGAE